MKEKTRKHNTRLFALCATLLAALIWAAPRAGAQEIPDSIFNAQSEAFGNILQDVPPDISEIEISPETPAADQRVWVRAVVRVVPDFSPFIVKRALLQYSTDKQNYTAIEMQLVDDEKGLWQAPIPGFPKGTTVYYTVAGWDELGNAVYQVPLQTEVSKKKLFHVITDENDADISAGVDILSMNYATNGELLYYCMGLETTFQTYTLSGATAAAMGYIAEDLRTNPHKSSNDFNGPFLAYMPVLGIATKITIDEFASSKDKKIEGVTVSANGRNVCARAPIKFLTSTPERGLKVFSATITFDPGTQEFLLADASPYAILYFGGNSYVVK
jgi:hypothetical protein